MLKLFEPMKIGKMELKNRFVRSATCEGMASKTGKVTDDLVKMYKTLSKGHIGLIILGYMYIHPYGRAFKYQTGIYSDEHISGIKTVIDIIHEEDGKVAVQIVHAGPQTYPQLIKTKPLGPSKKIMNPFTIARPKEMSEIEIQDTITLFGDAAKRAVNAGVDAIQIHAAHGYLINQFISPYFNLREDKWGGSDENRFRYLREICLEIKKVIPRDIPIFIKLNTHDHTPKEGITPPLAAKYAEWLVELGIDAIEISCGTNHYSLFNVIRGEVPSEELVQWLPESVRQSAKNMFLDMEGKYNLEEGYNLDAAKQIKPIIGKTPLILVGGLRTVNFMEEIIENNYADFVSMCRPFIREPLLVKQIYKGRKEKSACSSCNRCVAALPNNIPVRCYENSFPKKV
ncbi:MAG: NADH:flavin oxidoreductase [Candidatus Hermodarchaeota archaeon]